MGDSLPAVDLGTGRTAAAITAGGYHTCALLDNGQVKCWGYNAYGQLGLGNSGDRGDGSGEMGDSLPAVDLGTGRTATAITAGIEHTCAPLDNGQVKCWGLGFFGRLGLGDTDVRGDGPGEMGDSLPAVDLGTGRTAAAISTGNIHTCALLDNGQVKCWGYNAYGQLGLGNSVDRGDGPSRSILQFHSVGCLRNVRSGICGAPPRKVSASMIFKKPAVELLAGDRGEPVVQRMAAIVAPCGSRPEKVS
jgi:alpha-tubulin suppressor-like RCC1 family protein